jgi:hypothetical protein
MVGAIEAMEVMVVVMDIQAITNMKSTTTTKVITITTTENKDQILTHGNPENPTWFHL